MSKKRALLSVSDKTGLLDFAKGLVAADYELISTGGTATYLKDAGLEVLDVASVTGFPEILEGRVKTLHPAIHGGLLAKRDSDLHREQVSQNQIDYIDLVCVNLYPFEETVKKAGVTEAEVIENIDIGGPSMLRSAAKNHQDVTVVCDVADYPAVLAELAENGQVSAATRRRLAIKVYHRTFLMGSLGFASKSCIQISILPMCAGILLLALSGKYLNALSLGEEEAKSLGVNVARVKIFIILVATFVSALSVTIAGHV